MLKIFIDWQLIKTKDQMWEEIIAKSRHPSWHGRNLDALSDGWVSGCIDEYGPPYDFVFVNCQNVQTDLRELSVNVMEIAFCSVMENGGSLQCA